MRQFTAVVNPTAGGAGSAAALLAVARLLREAGAELETEYSRSLDHARRLAREAGEKGRVVLAVGGANILWLRAVAGEPIEQMASVVVAAIAVLILLSVVAIAIGVSVRGRRPHIDALIQRANALAHDREQQAALAVAEERTRIARELHDVVAHSLTVMVALADGARAASCARLSKMPRSPAQARKTRGFAVLSMPPRWNGRRTCSCVANMSMPMRRIS